MNRYKYSLLILALLLPLTASTSRADIAQPAKAAGIDSLQDAKAHTREEFVHSMASMTLSILQDQKKSFADRKIIFRQAFGSVVDIDWIAKFVVGRAWNNASDDQKARYTDLYRTYLTEAYVANFGDNPERRVKDIKILGIQDAEDNGFLVHTITKLASTEEFHVAYRVSDHEGKYKVIDIIIENVSLLAAHRKQFGDLAARQGVEGVISKLQSLNGDHQENAINISMK